MADMNKLKSAFAQTAPKKQHINTGYKPNPKIEALEKRVADLEMLITELANLIL